jgi:hypothetical protein
MELRIASLGGAGPRGVSPCCVLALLCLVLQACGAPPPPRSYDEFMDDRIAREGVILRCDANPEQAQDDIECANARRAAATIALSEERARRQDLERESKQKIAALKQEMVERERIAREAALAAARAEREAYEEIWRARGGSRDFTGSDPGATSGALPSQPPSLPESESLPQSESISQQAVQPEAQAPAAAPGLAEQPVDPPGD